MNNQKVRIVSLGGVGEVTKNMFVYEYWNEGNLVDILIADCGIGFSENGEEVILPDVSYLSDKKEKIRGIVLTHGHEDHTSALFDVLPRIGLGIPVYGTRLTTALASAKLEEFNLKGNFRTVKTTDEVRIGNFLVEFVHVTHSIPDAANLLIKTPIGAIYHGSDFKFDWTPNDGWPTEVGKIAIYGKKGILCLLSDCVRSEQKGYTPSEEAIEENLRVQLDKAKGRIIFTTQSSNISRIQQAIDIALYHHRKIVFLGRSILKNTEVSKKHHFLFYPRHTEIRKKDISKFPDNKLFLIIAGSQAQEDSALSRFANGDGETQVKVKETDTIIFSADPIPGYEKQVHILINKLTLKGATVVYSDINDELHVSGHGSQNDLMLMLGLTRPKYIIPIGGEPRHVKQYQLIANKMGYKNSQIFSPKEREAVEFDAFKNAKIVKIPTR